MPKKFNKKYATKQSEWVEACRIIAMKEFNLQFKRLHQIQKDIVKGIVYELLFCHTKQTEE